MFTDTIGRLGHAVGKLGIGFADATGKAAQGLLKGSAKFGSVIANAPIDAVFGVGKWALRSGGEVLSAAAEPFSKRVAQSFRDATTFSPITTFNSMERRRTAAAALSGDPRGSKRARR